MNVRKTIVNGAVCLSMLAGGFGIAQVSARRHANLAAAQRYCGQAQGALRAAQHANEYDMGGHAKKAEELLSDAYREIGEAAGAANRR